MTLNTTDATRYCDVASVDIYCHGFKNITERIAEKCGFVTRIHWIRLLVFRLPFVTQLKAEIISSFWLFFQNLGFSGFSVDCLKFRCDTRGHFLILKKCSFRPLFTKAQEVYSRNTYGEELNDKKNNVWNPGYLFYT